MTSQMYQLYHGPSRILSPYLDTDIVVLATGFKTPSKNRKTGPTIQVYILSADTSPVEAYDKGSDYIICGDCPARKWCYVNIGRDPSSVWKAWERGNFETATPSDFPTLFRGRKVRLGAYGDPAAVPASILTPLVTSADGHLGYTHQWNKIKFQWLKDYCMASIETEMDYLNAKLLGWRTFRLMDDVNKRLKNESVCPNETTGIQCTECGLCDGNLGNKKGDVVVTVHGSTKKYFSRYMVGKQ